jgi:hypothetical protein
MTWAARRRLLYILGTLLFLAVAVGIPLSILLYKPPTCFDGIQNQGETAVDKGGTCPLLDPQALIPHAVLWARAFPARDGSYSAIALIENPNRAAGVRKVGYHFRLYDERNVLVAERSGATFIMPGGVTPVFEGAIATGQRAAAHARFEFAEPLVWERLQDASRVLAISNTQHSESAEEARLSARVHNTSVASVTNPAFVAILSDPAGNAFAVSATALVRLAPGEERQLMFTWPQSFSTEVGRIDIFPLLSPETFR